MNYISESHVYKNVENNVCMLLNSKGSGRITVVTLGKDWGRGAVLRGNLNLTVMFELFFFWSMRMNFYIGLKKKSQNICFGK